MSALSPAATVRLVGTDQRLVGRVESVVPDHVGVEHVAELDAAVPRNPPHVLTVYCIDRFDEREQRRVESLLKSRPRRIAIVCREAEVGDVFELGVGRGAEGLIAIETDGSRERLGDRLPRWYWGGAIAPDWGALVALSQSIPPVVSRLQQLIDRRPFRDWRVEEAARLLGVTPRTLNRAVQRAYGRSCKELLQDVRFQLIEQARATNELGGEEIATLFGFESAQALYNWRRRYRGKRRIE